MIGIVRWAGQVAAGACLLLAVPGGAVAQDDVDRIFGGVGVFDILDEDTVPAFEAQWIPGVRYFDFIAPFVGGFATTDGAFYGGFGFGAEFVLDDTWVVMPFTGIGLFEDGDGKDLGSVVEFRSGVDLGYRFDYGGQISVTFTHMSNAGISDRNPGTELLMFRYGYPLQ